MQKSSSTPEFSEEQPLAAKPAQSAAKKSAAADVKPVKIAQSVVAATCPYCNHKQDLPFEKGRHGRPFFVACVAILNRICRALCAGYNVSGTGSSF